MHGIPIFAAVLTTGPETYPPVPIQMSGLKSLIIFFDAADEEKVLPTVFMFSAMLFGEKLRLKPLIFTWCFCSKKVYTIYCKYRRN